MEATEMDKAGGVKIQSSWITLINSRVVKLGKQDLYVEVNRHFFLNCIRPYLSKIRVDEAWYLQRHPDVAEAIRGGIIRNAKEHYTRYGYMENRMPYPIVVNEEWYSSHYLDVKRGIEKGDFSSAQHHFDTRGFLEGRSPYPDFVIDQVDEF